MDLYNNFMNSFSSFQIYWKNTDINEPQKEGLATKNILGLIEYCCNRFKGLTQKFVWFVVISSMNSVLKIGRCWYVQLLGFFLAKHSRNPEIKERTIISWSFRVSQITKVRIREWRKDYVQFSTFSYNILTKHRYAR